MGTLFVRIEDSHLLAKTKVIGADTGCFTEAEWDFLDSVPINEIQTSEQRAMVSHLYARAARRRREAPAEVHKANGTTAKGA
jgi:hypothetical protein